MTDVQLYIAFGGIVVTTQAGMSFLVGMARDHISNKRNPQPNGSLKTLETTMIEGFKEAAAQRDTLFERIHEIRDDLTEVREKVAFMDGLSH